jgi:hypothetical protein
MTNETPSNGTTQSLTFAEYIDQQNQTLLPRVNSLFKDGGLGSTSKKPDTLPDVLAVIKTLDPEKPDEWYAKTQSIVDAVMTAMPSLDPQKVTTAVVNDMANLFRGFKPLNVGGAGR